LVKTHNLTVNKDHGYHSNKYSFSEIKNALSNSQPNAYNKRFIEQSLGKKYDDYWILNWDEGIVAADAHSPFIHEKIFNLMLEVAHRYKIKNFLHAGDFWNQDQFSSFWISKEDLISFSDEVSHSKKVVKSLTDNFNDVRFFLGSHDTRFWKLLYSIGKADEYNTVWDLLENKKIKTSNYRYCELNETWRINHPKNTVKVGGLPAIRMNAKFGKSIIFGHGHWQGFVFAPDGKHVLMAPGCLVDPERISYRSLWDTSHDQWVPGFVMIVEKSKFIIFNENSPYGIYLKK